MIARDVKKDDLLMIDLWHAVTALADAEKMPSGKVRIHTDDGWKGFSQMENVTVLRQGRKL